MKMENLALRENLSAMPRSGSAWRPNWVVFRVLRWIWQTPALKALSLIRT